ncbi:MAG TPA: NUDIX domain-containing protein [Alphaproteobacteria bacterium]
MKKPIVNQQNALAILLHPTEQKILLGLREELPIWSLPGGKLDADETFTNALKREIREETCLEMDILNYVGDCRYLNSKNMEKHLTFYLCRAQDADARVTDEEIAWEWFAPDALPDNLFNFFRPIIADALSDKTDQVYTRRMTSKAFCLSLHADRMYGLKTWLTHPRVRNNIDREKLDFRLAQIEGIDAYL